MVTHCAARTPPVSHSQSAGLPAMLGSDYWSILHVNATSSLREAWHWMSHRVLVYFSTRRSTRVVIITPVSRRRTYKSEISVSSQSGHQPGSCTGHLFVVLILLWNSRNLQLPGGPWKEAAKFRDFITSSTTVLLLISVLNLVTVLLLRSIWLVHCLVNVSIQKLALIFHKVV